MTITSCPLDDADSRIQIADAALQSALDCIVATDANGSIVEFNPAAECTFGWSRADAIGRDMDELIIPQQHREAHRAGMARYLATGVAHVLGRRVELEALHRDGHVFPVELSIVEIGQSSERLFIATMRDLTARREAERERDEARAQLLGFFDHIPTSIYLKRVDHTVVYVSKHLAEQYGKTPNDMVGRHEYDLHIEEMKPHLKMMDEYILSTGQAFLAEGTHLQFNRQELVSRFPIFNEKGEITHIGGVNFDINDKSLAQAELTEAKSLVDAFIQNAPNVMVLMKPTGQYVMINEAAARYYGKSPEELIKAGPKVVNAPFTEAQKKIVPLMARVIANRKAEAIETLYVMPSGEVREISFTLFPILGANGDIAYVGCISHDFTEERRAEAEAEQARARFEAFFNNAPAAMYIRDLENRVVMVNQWGAQMFGHKPKDLIGMPVTLARRPEDAARIKMVDAELHRTGLPQIEEIVFDRQGNSSIGKCTIFPIKDREGAISQVGALIFDVTEERRTQTQLAASQESLHQSEKLAALGQLLAGVAHELNNPLAIVLGRAAILKDKLAGTPYVDSIQKLRDAADRCARIVKTFLAMARQTGPRRSNVQINELIEGAHDMTAYGLRTADIQFNQNLDPTLPAIEADEDQIVQLLINLIINAQHALEGRAGERRLTIRTKFDVEQRLAVIEVADNGPGVPADVAARIFEPFFTTKGIGEGTGLGLSVCKGMVEAHGGTLTLHQTKGGGATFRATFPLLDAIARENEVVNQEVRLFSGHILIVDDEPEIAAILADCLAPIGVSCAIASDGATALSLISNTHFDAVFCDVRMPGMDGIAFYARIKAEQPELAARLAFVSGDVLHRDLARLRAASDRPIIEKPFDPKLVRDIAMLLLTPDGEAQ